MNTFNRTLVTGGTGNLGSYLVPALVRQGHQVRIMSRRPQPAETPYEWAHAWLESGAGLDSAVAGVTTIIHAATGSYNDAQAVDVHGTGRLLEAAARAGVAHFVYISIVGADRIPAGYLQAKFAAEQQIMAGAVPWTILRATQFHTLIDQLLNAASRIPLALPLPLDFQFQPVATAEVAGALARAATGQPAGRLPDMGGPRLSTLRELATTWLAARGLRRRLLHLPFPGKVAGAFRRGLNTNTEGQRGAMTWEQWLEESYGSSGALHVQTATAKP